MTAWAPSTKHHTMKTRASNSLIIEKKKKKKKNENELIELGFYQEK